MASKKRALTESPVMHVHAIGRASAVALAVITAHSTCLAADVAEPILQTPVFIAGEGGYHSYRIPSLLATPKGALLAFCEGRVSGRGDAGDIDLVLKRSFDGGKTWGETQVLWNDGANTCGNPCPVFDYKTGNIHLLLTQNLGDDNEAQIKLNTGKGSRTVWVCHSDDDGVTWTEPQEITKQAKRPEWTWYATGPGVGIQIEYGMHAGRLVIPCDHGFHDPHGTRQDVQSEYGAHVIFSDDHGESWQIGGAIVPKMNECQVVELTEPAGALLLDMRSYRGQACRAESTSTDGGETWSKAVDVPTLVEPVCQASLIRQSWPQGNQPGLLLFSNPADAKKRVALTIRSSADDGKSWSSGYELHAGPAAYSCLAKLSDDAVGCLYERGDRNAYEQITFARVPVSLLNTTTK